MKKITLLLSILCISIFLFAQKPKVLVYDVFHGQNPEIAWNFSELLDSQRAQIRIDSSEIAKKNLDDVFGLILFLPGKPMTANEIKTIVNFIKHGGSLLFIIDEEKRTPLYSNNNFLKPFGMELTETIPYLHNCGAVAEKSDICADKREIPYSGGRSVKGGTVVSKVLMDKSYVHCAYTKEKDAKIIVMGDGMAGLFMGQADGVRLTGTVPADTKYWGKDSKVFMEEIFDFFIE